MKSTAAKNTERARRAMVPRRGEVVMWPDPLPPVTDMDPASDHYTFELAPVGCPPVLDEEGQPTGEVYPEPSEHWFRGKVLAVHEHGFTNDPDDYVVDIEPEDGGPPVQVAVMFLRGPE